jgi:hypothetical protein
MAFAALAPVAAQAAAPAELPKITKTEIDKGMKEAPAVVAEAGVTCTVVNARFIGTMTMAPTGADPKAKDAKPVPVSGYEVACKEGLGYTVLTMKPTATANDCVASALSPSLACRLPENANPKAGLTPFMTEAGRPCAVNDAKFLGATPAGTKFYEVSCKPGEGYLLQREPGKPAAAFPCISAVGGKLACTLTSDAQSVAYAKTLAAGVKKPCDVKDVHYIGMTSSGLDGYEIACAAANAGFIFTITPAGEVKQQVDCALAASFLGGCKLTDTTKAETAENAIYTDLAKKAGFKCQVNKYRLIGVMAGNTDVVELACADRPDGAVAAFAEDASKSKIYDCVQVGELGQDCKLGSSLMPVYDKLSASLAAKGKGSCKVAGARYIGGAANGASFYETACSDGGLGWVIKTAGAGYVADTLIPCATATGDLACKLPTNIKK